MSAFLVGNAHIDALVQACGIEGLIPVPAQGDPASQFGRALLFENHRSLRARYADLCPDSPDEIDYQFTGVEAPLDDLEVIRAAMCWQYQSCEHGDRFHASQAAQTIAELIAKLADRHGVSTDDLPPGDVWAVRTIDDVVAS